MTSATLSKISAALLFVPIMSGGLVAGELASVTRVRMAMGTLCEITVISPSEDASLGAIEEAFAEIRRLETIFSLYQSGSEISRLNRSPVGKAFQPSEDLARLIVEAEKYRRRTGGAFDSTIEPLMALFRRGNWTDAEWEKASEAAGPGQWQFHGNGSVTRLHEGAGLNLDGIAKGYALDQAAVKAFRAGAAALRFNFGGQVLALQGDPYVVDLEAPGEAGTCLVSVPLRNGSASTSSQKERFVERPGGRVGHILDPKKGTSVPSSGAVTVLARTGTEADALSTAMLVLGPDAGFAFLKENFPEASAVYVLKADGKWTVRPSEGLSDLVFKQ